MKTIFYSKNNCPICGDFLNIYQICSEIDDHYFNLEHKTFSFIKENYSFIFDYIKKKNIFEINVVNGNNLFKFERDTIYSIDDAFDFANKFIENLAFL